MGNDRDSLARRGLDRYLQMIQKIIEIFLTNLNAISIFYALR